MTPRPHDDPAQIAAITGEDARRQAAENYIGCPLATAGEVDAVLDAIADGDDPTDALDEYRQWHSPQGRRAAMAEAFENGRF